MALRGGIGTIVRLRHVTKTCKDRGPARLAASIVTGVIALGHTALELRRTYASARLHQGAKCICYTLIQWSWHIMSIIKAECQSSLVVPIRRAYTCCYSI